MLDVIDYMEYFSEFGEDRIREMAESGMPVEQMMFEFGLPISSKMSFYRYCDKVGIQIRNRSLKNKECEKAVDLDSLIDGMKPGEAINHLKYVINLLTGHDEEKFVHWRKLGFTPSEAKMILFLLHREGEFCSKERIYHATVMLYDVTGEKSATMKAVDVRISHIRKKFANKNIRGRSRIATGPGSAWSPKPLDWAANSR